MALDRVYVSGETTTSHLIVTNSSADASLLAAPVSFDEGSAMRNRKTQPPRVLALSTILLMILLGLAACGGGSNESIPLSDESSQPPAEPGPAGVTLVSGHVSVADTGEPYPGATIEFKNVNGGNVHTTTDEYGDYTLPVPDDVYTALALDLEDPNMGFDVANGGDNAVSVPPVTQVDFVAYPIN